MTDSARFLNTRRLAEFTSWDQQAIEILGVMADPDECRVGGDNERLIDPESMPALWIKKVGSDETNVAYPDELDQAFWPPELKEVLDGEMAYQAAAGQHLDHPLNDGHFFALGWRLAQFKAGE